MPSSIASIDISSTSSYDSDEEYRLAQEEWEESLQQLKQLVSVVLLPFVGKWMGRRWSHWGVSSLFRFSPVSIPPDLAKIDLVQHTLDTSALVWGRPSFSANSALSLHERFFVYTLLSP